MCKGGTRDKSTHLCTPNGLTVARATPEGHTAPQGLMLPSSSPGGAALVSPGPRCPPDEAAGREPRVPAAAHGSLLSQGLRGLVGRQIPHLPNSPPETRSEAIPGAAAVRVHRSEASDPLFIAQERDGEEGDGDTVRASVWLRAWCGGSVWESRPQIGALESFGEDPTKKDRPP